MHYYKWIMNNFPLNRQDNPKIFIAESLLYILLRRNSSLIPSVWIRPLIRQKGQPSIIYGLLSPALKSGFILESLKPFGNLNFGFFLHSYYAQDFVSQSIHNIYLLFFFCSVYTLLYLISLIMILRNFIANYKQMLYSVKKQTQEFLNRNSHKQKHL